MSAKNFKQFLSDLLNASSPSGQEEKAIKVWDDFMSSLPNVSKYYSDKMGNSAWSIGDGNTKILLSGHIDQVNARVSLIHDSGLIALHYTGGIDNRSLYSGRVLVLTDDGKEVEGAVIKQPLHLDKDTEWPENHRDFSKIRVDVGAESKEEVEKLGIHPGCLVIYKPEVSVDWGENKICSVSLDDKIAVFAVGLVLQALSDDLKKHKESGNVPAWYNQYTIIGLAATQEETGLRGATVAAKNINPDISIDADVEFCTDDELSGPKEKIGDIKLGKGPILTYGADKSVRVNRVLKDMADFLGVKYQYASTGCGGTNTDAIQLNSADCETAHLAIPNQAMHSRCEICHWSDVQGAIDILGIAILDCKL